MDGLAEDQVPAPAQYSHAQTTLCRCIRALFRVRNPSSGYNVTISAPHMVGSLPVRHKSREGLDPNRHLISHDLMQPLA